MKDVLGLLLVVAIVVMVLIFAARDRPASVAQRRHNRYQRRYMEAKTPADQLRHANAYLDEVASAASDQVTAAIAKEVFALAVKRNGAGAAPAGPAQVVSQKPV